MSQSHHNQSVLGRGVYGIPEAARLIGTSPQRLGAWFRGWRGGREPLLKSDYEVRDATQSISFLDLVDAGIVALLRPHVSLHTIRRLNDALSTLWTYHPFSRQEFYTDTRGRRIFVEMIREEDGDSDFIELLKHQHAMPDVLKPVLTHISYDSKTNLAGVLNLTESVVLDPRRRYGKPIVESCGMPTAVLYASFLTNGRDADFVADWYGVDSEEVRIAVDFEVNFCGLAA